MPEQIDGVVTVSTTGIATPSLDARAAPKVGFRDDIRRVPVFGLGCAGGVNGLATASRMAAGEPGTNWLFVTVETCSISIRLDSDDPAAVVATALFGDGAATAVVRRRADLAPSACASAEKAAIRWIMGWDVGIWAPSRLHRAIPHIRGEGLRGGQSDVLPLGPRAEHRFVSMPSRRFMN
jgi:alkylresorcinol/alkylpyrone synthase